ncbi:Predicted arabinose efflux permease, MFS family [Micromonospora pattaloongensis]|uniref:Predicted arabinose efflux permease, MFS family n=1 Tax=Micromonospora pattaloongensis TaxID=405436 RepID=A0A1H3S452_9ACTN|nr:MFS transporter [Micromonospora pattaloongensis]SDZ32863.1 Predicted arabinose efflux permease, MFS family [Micromonospora pattaloongensis]
MSATQLPSPAPVSSWAPLRNTVFRNLWLAVLASNIGTWMQTVGAQWLLVHQPNASTLVALVQTASMLPILLLALPAGALADTLDRRRLMLAVQLFLFAVGAVLTTLTAFGRMPPALLLTLTFALGAGQALTLPAWQAVIPGLVSRAHIPAASALGSISVNLARAVGPAVAGLLVARVGVPAVFALNTLSFLVFALALLRWRTDEESDTELPERFGPALRAGGRYVRHSPVVRRILLRAALFVVPGSALWALLPLVATQRLGMGSGGYGVLLAAMGSGAVAGAVLLPRIRTRMSNTHLLLLAGFAFGLVLLVLALVRVVPVVTLALLPAGMAWMTVLSNVNAAMQLFLPGWVRARGLSIYQMVFSAGQALGALAWGGLAQATSLVVAYVVAAGVMLAGAATVRIWPLFEVAGLNRDPAAYWPEPHLVLEPHPHAGPVPITVTYTVEPARQEEFLAAMPALRRSRLRTGAVRWGIYREGEAPQRFVEIYVVPSWDEHLRQHAVRLTEIDRHAEERARALAQGEPEVRHLLPPVED